ncbi:hypothetical protein ACROYT_G029594 [Oculina patagonica]
MMEANIFLVLSFFALLSTALGWRNCSLELAPNIQLPVTCNTTSYDCSQITCSATFSQEDIRLSVYIDQWEDPMSADVTVSVPELRFDWSARFKDGDRLELPGFPLEIEGFSIGEANVYLEFSLKKENGTITFKVDLLASTEFAVRSYKITLVEGKIPEAPEPIATCFDCNGWGYYKNGFQRLPLISRVMIITSVITFLILVVLSAVFCCKRNRATTADQVKVKPPSYDEATSTKTKVPMQPLLNEV